ncbi:hypothetical protein CMEL01_11265 [Colletotrichum melonis]|uniref:Uncharacterized protein n=1 Tax=Colletotrichum melonis TaxID=1209925 RepID=A0AAI9UYN4_9PEZI|nr:hypothetical protein CMEL01_11265 [Colletotrichum melonis]
MLGALRARAKSSLDSVTYLTAIRVVVEKSPSATPYDEANDDNATDAFFLTDHALIWQAFQALESMDIKLPMVTSRGNPKPRVYTSKVVQQNIIKRFTTQNPVSRKRMLAVSRTPSNTRFYFRTKDAALFRAMEKGLFDESSSSEVSQEGWDKMIEVWKNTVDCQKLHEDNTDVDWNEPLCFALSIAIARNQKSMNTRAPEDMKSLSLAEDLTEQNREKNDKKAPSPSMKHHFPFGNTIELQSIVELEDEWLYNKPLFFSQDALGMSKATDDTPILGVVIDVPKAGKGAEAREEDSRSVKISRVSTMENLLDRRLRTPKDAKKRLWAMFSAGPDDITHCENTAGPDPITQHQMANFHQSHKSFEKHFEEETVAKLNTWTTELYLSFYDILEGNKSQKEPQDTGDLSLPPTEAKLVDTFLTRVPTSCHIEGNFLIDTGTVATGN